MSHQLPHLATGPSTIPRIPPPPPPPTSQSFAASHQRPVVTGFTTMDPPSQEFLHNSPEKGTRTTGPPSIPIEDPMDAHSAAATNTDSAAIDRQRSATNNAAPAASVTIVEGVESIPELPEDILRKIATYTIPADLPALRAASRLWRDILDDDGFEEIWARAYRAEWTAMSKFGPESWRTAFLRRIAGPYSRWGRMLFFFGKGTML